MTAEQRAAKIMVAVRQNAPADQIERYIVIAINKAVGDARARRDFAWAKSNPLFRAVNAHDELLSVCKKIQENLPHLYARAGVWPTENTFTKELT